MLVGAGAVVVGLAVYFGLLGWFGRLPGDIRYESDNTRIYVPITSMIVLSVALSIGAYLLRRLF